MRPSTEAKVANLLAAVASTLRQGRPRMLPGCMRDEAQTSTGRRIRPTHPLAAKFSLTGALKADAKLLGYGFNVREYAAWAILDETENLNGGSYPQLRRLDIETYDTRAVIRLVKAAQRTTERHLATTTKGT